MTRWRCIFLALFNNRLCFVNDDELQRSLQFRFISHFAFESKDISL